MTVSVARSIRRGESKKLLAPSTGSGAIGIENYGVSHLTGATETYVLDAPVEGVEKKILVNLTTQSTGTTLTVRGSTGTSVTFGPLNTQFVVTASSAARAAAGVHLVGLSTAQWGLLSVNGATFGTT